jgi:Holliday junction resolvase RusA-like endonuclease
MAQTERLGFFIKGCSKPKPRPRMTKQGHAYTPKEGKLWEQKILTQALPYAPEKPLECPVRLDTSFRFLPPKSWPKWKREHVLDGQPFTRYGWFPRVSGADLDNLRKAVCDALTGVFWVDDRQVTAGYEEKVYYIEEGIRIVIVPLPRIPKLKKDVT